MAREIGGQKSTLFMVVESNENVICQTDTEE